MRSRSIASIVILSILTCGIYYYFCLYEVFSDINYSRRENESAATDILLCLVTCGIWEIYCYYRYSKKLYDMGADDCVVVNVLLSVFRCGIVSLCIMQSNINDLIDRNR